MAHAAEAGHVDSRLHGEDLAGLENGFGKSRRLVDFQAEAVAGAVEKSLPAAVFNLGRIALVGEEFFHHVVDDAAFDPGFHRIEGEFLALQAGVPKSALLLAGAAPNDRAGDVAVEARANVAWEDVEDEELVGKKLTRSAMVGIAGLLATSDDRVPAGLAPGTDHGGFHLDAEEFGGQVRAVEGQRAVLQNLRGAEDFDATGHSDLRDADGIFQSMDLGSGFDFALWHKRAANGLHIDAGFFQIAGVAEGKIRRDFNLTDIFGEEPGRDDFRVGGGFARSFFGEFGKFGEGLDGINLRFGAATIDFEVAEQNVFFAYRLKIRKGVGRAEPAEIKQVCIGLGTSDEEFGSSHGFRGAVYLNRERVEGQRDLIQSAARTA